MDALKRFRDETFSKRYSDELLAERKWNRKTLIFIFIASTLFYTSDILISNFCLNVRKLPTHELVLVLALLGARAIGFFYYLKYERNAYPRVFQVYELFFVLLFGATTIATWNAEINMDMKRSFIIGIDAGWVLRYILVLFGQWKFKAFIDLSVVIFGIIKLAIFVKAFDMGYIQAGFQMIFVLMLLYSKERVEKMKFLRTVSLKRTEQTLKNILDNIPENIAVLNLDGDLIYFNEYLDICFGVNNQDPDEIDLFSKFFSIKPRERYFNAESWTETDHMSRPLRRKTIRKLPMRKITLTPQNFKAKQFIEHNRHLKEESEFTGKKQNMLNNSNLDKSMTESKPSRSRMKDSHASLTEAITSIEQFSSLQDVIDFFVANIVNLRGYSNKANNFFIFDSKYRETEESTVKSYEIKISLASFDGDESFILILRDTTHRDIIATLESNNTYKDSVLSSISHELRTPLNTNLNMLDMAIKDPDTSEQLKEDRLIPAHQSGKLLQSLINDILDYSMSLAGKLVMNYKTKSLRKTLEKVKYLAESQAKRKNLDFHIRISDKISNELYTDHKRLRQVLVNLLSNALKFTSEGEIVLSVDEWGEENKIIKFAVSDTGIGMTEADMDRLRAVFKKNSFSEKLTGSSAESGMGLMMSQMLIKKMGPIITKLSGLKFESRHGEGSTFWFFINTKTDTPITSSFQEGNRENYFNYQQTTGGNQSSSPPRQLTEPKEGENNIMNTDASSSQIRLIDARRKLTRRPTYEPILQGAHENFQTNGSMEREATLGDEDQFEEERACMIKNNNLILGKSINDLSSTEGRRLPHPRLLSTTPNRTKGSALNLPEIKIAFADDDGHGGCDCPKILVVDDDVFNLFTMKSLMKGFGLTITEAHNGVQAVEAVKKRVATKCSERCQGFRLILMDLSMPVMDGFEATLKLKELMALGQVPYIPIVACTAFVDPDKTDKCFKCGMQSRISKPVSKNKLQEVLKTYNIPFI